MRTSLVMRLRWSLVRLSFFYVPHHYLSTELMPYWFDKPTFSVLLALLVSQGKLCKSEHGIENELPVWERMSSGSSSARHLDRSTSARRTV